METTLCDNNIDRKKKYEKNHKEGNFEREKFSLMLNIYSKKKGSRKKKKDQLDGRFRLLILIAQDIQRCYNPLSIVTCESA